MGLDASTAMLAANLVNGGTSLVSGINQYRAANAEASATRDEARQLFRSRKAQGDVEALQAERRARAIQGSIRARGAAYGMDVAGAVDDAGAMGALDALTIRNNAFLEAQGYHTRGHLRALGLRSQGYSGLLTGGLRAAQSALSIAGQEIARDEGSRRLASYEAARAAAAVGRIRLPRMGS